VILTARELTGVSQRQLAARLGTSQSTIATIESGNRVPTIRTLTRIAQATGFELVIGLRSAGAPSPLALGALVTSDDDGLADHHPMVTPSPFDGPPDA
jgi:transcriptional regulator with XRE-family HTH domain